MKKLVIIGGGFTGSHCAKKLGEKFETVLIDDKDYFEFTPSILRTIVEPKHIKKIQVLHTHYLTKTEIIRGCVTNIADNHVYTNNKKFYFDYLIISSGSSYSLPIKVSNMVKATRAKNLRECYHNLKKAEKIVLVGGGLVGVELAAEIIEKYPLKKISIIQSSSNLITRNNPKSINYADKYLRKKGAKIIYGERVVKHEGTNLITKSGKKIESDMVFLCTGIISNYKFMKNNFSKYLNKKNQIIANKFLQLPDHKNIFIAGDVINILEEKTAQTSEKHASIVVKNICNLEKEKKLCEYIPKKSPMAISLGKHDGILEYKNLVITGIFPSIIKKYIEWKTMRKYNYSSK